MRGVLPGLYVADLYSDQAAGLRRLFGKKQVAVVAFAAGGLGVGKTVALVNLAAVLAKQGREVLIVDENPPHDGVASALGLLTHQDFIHVLQGESKLEEVIVQAGQGISVLPAYNAVRKFGRLSHGQRQSLRACLDQLKRPVDFVLVDAAADDPMAYFGSMAQEQVVVLTPEANPIKQAYGLIKKLSSHGGGRPCRILLNKVKGSEDPFSIFRNMASLAASKGLAPLSYGGSVPLDDCLRQASLHGQALVAMFPGSDASAALARIATDMANWCAVHGPDPEVDHYVQQLLNLNPRIPAAALGAA